jgi:hypothetical protein
MTSDITLAIAVGTEDIHDVISSFEVALLEKVRTVESGYTDDHLKRAIRHQVIMNLQKDLISNQ